MALKRKKNGEIKRVPGRAIPKSLSRSGVLGELDRYPLSMFRKFAQFERNVLLNMARREKYYAYMKDGECLEGSIIMDCLDKIAKRYYYREIKYYTSVIKKNPEYSRALYCRGKCKYEIEDFKGALKDLNKAIYIYPLFADAYMVRSKVRYKINDRLRALEDYALAVKLKPAFFDPYIEEALKIKNIKKKQSGNMENICEN